MNNNLENEKNQQEKYGEWIKPIINAKGKWKCLYAAIDKQGNTVGFLLTKRKQRMSVQSL